MEDRLVPDDFVVPVTFSGPGFHLEPLGPEHNERDHEAWMSSMDHIHATQGEWGAWPRVMTLEKNMADMEMHAREFRERAAFTYSILDGDEVIGCLYIYPDEKEGSDAYVRSWVRASRAEMDVVVWGAVGEWLTAEWPFRSFRYAERPG